MRVAWQRKKSGIDESVSQSSANRLVYIAYNVIWWAPIILPFIGVIDYRTGFIVLFVVTLVRAISNLYRNNFLTPEQAAYFPLRSP
jgi:hypothetical protein